MESGMKDVQPALRLEGVSKWYGDFAAVQDLSFEVPSGVIYGILGPNGAGKTTTLRMINDILLPDSGAIELFGNLRPGSAAARQIGYLPEERGLYPKMKVIDTLVFFGCLRGLSARNARARADGWLERLQLSDWAKHNVQDLSKGMQQKVQFAAALIHDPQLLILDEPWSGLDPINAEVLKEIVVAQKQAGKTILFSTHLMEQAESLCDHVCIIAAGRKAVEGRLDVIKKDAASEGVVIVDFFDLAERERAMRSALSQPLVESVREDNDGLVVQLGSGGTSEQLLAVLVRENLRVRRYESKSPSLHEIFVDRVGAMEGRDRRRNEGVTGE